MDNLLANNITELIGNTPAVKLPDSFTKNQFEVIGNPCRIGCLKRSGNGTR